VTQARLFDPLSFAHGPVLPNRLALAPLTNTQSHADGRLGDDELRWLALRAAGGFGLTMTCAAHVQANGQGFAGQLGIFNDSQVEGLTRLAAAVRREGSLAIVQLHHAGMRAPATLIRGQPVCASDNSEQGARGLTTGEVEQVIADFIAAARRAERAGFDGIELHGAHGYLLSQFLSPQINRRTDRFGGPPANRARILDELLDGIRAHCRPDFVVGLRLSPERFGLDFAEMRALAARLLCDERLDFLDLSLWDVFKEPTDEQHRGRSLLGWFTDLPREGVRLGAAGRLRNGADVARCLAEGADFAIVGRAAILHHDLPQRLRADPDFQPLSLPVSAAHLTSEGVGPAFLDYLRGTFKGFVAD
jgi:2,4-dienoyl-CoA reductase-like NADH-dependent reductase (Old Yellow Enzyme family)